MVLGSVRPVLRALCLSSGKTHGWVPRRDSIVGQDARGARAPRYWPLAGPSLSIPYSKGAQSGCRIRRWANLPTYGPRRAVEVFLTHIPLTCDESWPIMRGETSNEFFEGTDRDCMRTSRGETLWLIMAGAEIQAGGWFPRIHRPYKTKEFIHRVSYLASLPPQP